MGNMHTQRGGRERKMESREEGGRKERGWGEMEGKRRRENVVVVVLNAHINLIRFAGDGGSGGRVPIPKLVRSKRVPTLREKKRQTTTRTTCIRSGGQLANAK